MRHYSDFARRLNLRTSERTVLPASTASRVSWVPVTPRVPIVEEILRRVAPDRRVGDDFDGVTQFVANRSHQVPVGLVGIAFYPHDSARSRHREADETGAHSVAAVPFADIHVAVAGVDRLDQLTEGRGSFGCL